MRGRPKHNLITSKVKTKTAQAQSAGGSEFSLSVLA
jgi:hypothetical protein